ncbi:MAG: SOS response-associated peptidase [Lamprobacter sp.]|uniref:SOS response-associated peptidase n=1 Tax=Lamprobacter sp. TaxID=3100796 RepID=UPI002B259CF1|nr:SOS response-associated peptidase [Lamprobacter sp.]MEA3642421.1 SOS response-associated peptidase [Lamprobacter sp.]
MCGRFAQCSDPESLARHFRLQAKTGLAVQPSYNVAPTQPILAMRLKADDQRPEWVRLRWGLVPFWSKGPDNRYRMINARAETVASKPAYRAAFRERRCLIPADAFYEWQAGADGKQPFAIRRTDRTPFAMAGLFEHWQGEDGSVIDSCTIIVTEANALLRPIHERMPVILDPADYGAWLGTVRPDRMAEKAWLQSLLKPADTHGWEAYPVSRAVNKPGNDRPELLAPITTAYGSND